MLLLECKEYPLLELDDYNFAYYRLSHACEVVKSSWSKLKVLEIQEGTYADFRVHTIFEDFEFDLHHNFLVRQMLHLNKKGENRKDIHNEFKSKLKVGLTLEEAVVYVAEHTIAKYLRDSAIVFNKDVYEKVKAHKKYNFEGALYVS